MWFSACHDLIEEISRRAVVGTHFHTDQPTGKIYSNVTLAVRYGNPIDANVQVIHAKGTNSTSRRWEDYGKQKDCYR